jgi:hypothetical protein
MRENTTPAHKYTTPQLMIIKSPDLKSRCLSMQTAGINPDNKG